MLVFSGKRVFSLKDTSSLDIRRVPSVQRSISETASLSTNLKPFLLQLSNRRTFNCCIDAGLTLELDAIPKMKILPVLLFLHLRPKSMLSLQMSFNRLNAFKETPLFYERIKFSHSQVFKNNIAKKEYFLAFSSKGTTEN